MKLLEKALMAAANKKLQDVGHLQELHIDTNQRCAAGVLLLVGETRPIDITVGQYQFVKDEHRVILQLRDVSCSKEWMDKLAGKLEPQMNLELPPAAAAILKFMKIV